ncbi:tetratricopeptide repeat protein, partial [Candidatus Thioglobus sp.]|nr:tetratricopeptide repeat protein [Candidatus Thioglobus sp.]
MKDAKNQPTISKQEVDSVIALYKSGKYHEVIKQIKVLNEIYPRVPFLFNLAGVCYKSVGELASSAKMFETAVNIKPDYFEAHKNLGLVFKNLGQVNESIDSLNMAISIKSDYFDAHYNLAIILKELGRHDQALNSYEKAISINPNFANAYNNLGNLYLDLGREDDAINSYSRAIQINPNFAQAHNNLGNLFKDIERYEDAIQSYKKAIKANPQLSEAINNLGNLFKTLNQLDNAINCYKKAVAINPHFAEAHYNLGIVFKKTNKKEKALISLERAFSLKPSMDYILGDLLSAKCNFCSWDDYYALIDELQLKISNNKKVVNPFNLLGLIDDPSLQRKAAEIFANDQYPKKYALPEIQQYQKHPRIRIGYFSADFHNHATMHLMAELFELHKKSLFEIIAFSFGPDKKDEWRQRAVNSFDKFIDVRHKSDLEVSMIAREMEIDIAVDLKGYTRDCRPKIFVESCAPIQVSFLGYPGTMATDFIDYLIADQTLIPKEKRAHYSEKIAYMP